MPPLNDMRKYHNDIKRKYINKYIVKPKSTLLDLACGKGGDLNKWISNKNIVKVTGYDFNGESIKEAKSRLSKLKIRKNLDISFNVQNLAAVSLECEQKFEYITSFFAFHYFFHSRQTLTTILKSINNCSKKNTVLILTLFDGSKLKDTKEDNYSITRLDPLKKSNYGNRVSVYIKGSVLDVPTIEYIVNPDFLIKKMESINFKLIERKDFDINSKLSKAEQYLSSLNTTFVFRKIT